MCGGGVWWGGVCGLCWGVWVGVHAISARSRRDIGAISARSRRDLAVSNTVTLKTVMERGQRGLSASGVMKLAPEPPVS